MKIGSFEFSLRELAGSTGDFGTLIPLVMGYIVVCGLNPSGIFIMIGLASVVLGLVYRLPVPVQPMKVLAVAAIAQQWSPSMVYACGFAMGIIWLVFTATGIVDRAGRFIPHSVVRGIQVALGILLVGKALNMVSGLGSAWWLLGIVSVIVALILRRNRYAPSAIVLMILGVVIMLVRGQFQGIAPPSLNILPLTIFSFKEIWQTLLLAGFAQIPLTATNAVISVASLTRTYWPDKPIKEKRFALNMGIMNVLFPFFGGMPVCHGAGGLASQHYFGARTGGAKIMEGVIYLSIGLFLTASIAKVLAVFPMAIVGAMLFLVGIELIRLAKDIGLSWNLTPMAATVLVSLITKGLQLRLYMAYGFVVGLVAHYVIELALKGRLQWLYKPASLD